MGRFLHISRLKRNSIPDSYAHFRVWIQRLLRRNILTTASSLLVIMKAKSIKWHVIDYFIILTGLNPDTEQLTVGHPIRGNSSSAVQPISHIDYIPDAVKASVEIFENHFKRSGREPYHPEDRSGFWRHLRLRSNLDGQVLALVMVHQQDLTSDDLDEIKSKLRSLIKDTPIVSLHFQVVPSSHMEKQDVELIAGSTHIIEKMCGLQFAISPLASFQVF